MPRYESDPNMRSPDRFSRPASGSEARSGTELEWSAFAAVDMRVGTVTAASPLPQARNPAIVLTIDFGETGVLRSSAQITQRYEPQDLVGRQVVAVVNLPAKQIGSLMSECLVLGVASGDSIVLLGTDSAVPNGARVH